MKYHVALVSPLVNALYKYDCDNYALGSDKETIRILVRAAEEGGRVLKALGYTKRQPFVFNLFYWLPEMLVGKVVQGILRSKFAEIAFSLHARAAQDEMKELASEFRSLIVKTSEPTANIDTLESYGNLDI